MLDLRIINGRIIDGTGAPWYRGDVGVRGDTIVSIGDLSRVSAATTIDAHDNVVSPGFIDLLGQSQGAVFVDPHLEAKVRQGVTTEVTGEGSSPGPLSQKQIDTANPKNRPKWHTLGEWFTLLEKNGSAINFALFAGADNPREMVIGDVNRPPTAEEMREMEQIEEIINLAKVAAKYGGVYFSHMRDEGDRIDSALDEAFRIGREAKIPVNIWHLKTGGAANWGRMPFVIERINAARAEGLDVAANVYPYAASSTSLSTLVPDWALEGGYAELKKRLADPAQRTRIAEVLQAQFKKRGAKGIYITRTGNPAFAQFDKHFVEEIAAMMNVAPDEAMMRLFAETNSSPNVIFFSMSEMDVQTALKQSFVSIGSDSGSPPPAARAIGQAVHPRAYGTFPRVMGHYVRDEHLFTLEEAVRKATSQAADRTNLSDRGVLRPGMKADVVVFDAAKIRDVSTYEDPHHFSEGVLDVIVNGKLVLRDGAMTSALPGRVLRGRGYRR